jgi:hypothetical protein
MQLLIDRRPLRGNQNGKPMPRKQGGHTAEDGKKNQQGYAKRHEGILTIGGTGIG